MKAWPFVLIAGLLGVGLLVGSKFLPADTVLEFHGKVTEAGTGKPMPDTFVLINVMGYREEPITGHGNSGCIPASAAVRTDAQGNYHYRYDWSKDGDKGIPNGGVRMQVYKAGYERDVPAPTLGEWLIPGENVDFVLRKASTELKVRSHYLFRTVNQNCARQHGVENRGWMDLYLAVHEEVWTSYCSEYGVWRELRTSRNFGDVVHWLNKPLTIKLEMSGPQNRSEEFTALVNQYQEDIRKIVPGYSSTDMTDDLLPEALNSSLDKTQISEKQYLAICNFFAPEKVKARISP